MIILMFLGDPKETPAGVFIEQQIIEDPEKSLSPRRFVARPALALHHGNTGSAKSWGASTPPISSVRTGGEKSGKPHPREWGFDASESDLSDGHLIFARDRVEFYAFGTFRAMSEIWMFCVPKRAKNCFRSLEPRSVGVRGNQTRNDTGSLAKALRALDRFERNGHESTEESRFHRLSGVFASSKKQNAPDPHAILFFGSRIKIFGVQNLVFR